MSEKGWLRKALDFIFGFLADKSAEPSGKFKVGFHKELGSGYNVKEDRMKRVERLKDICFEVLADPSLEQDGDFTFCNRGNARIANAMGCKEISRFMLAAEQIEFAKGSDKFRIGTGQEATDHAKKGGYAFAGKVYPKSAHVAAVYPTDTKFSGSWGVDVPMLANIGKSPNAVMKTSRCFPVAAGIPYFFLYGDP